MVPDQPITAAMWTMFLGLLVLVPYGRGYPGGAPDMACQSMLPTGHEAAPQASDPPYSIFVSKKSYKPGETLQVVVQSEEDDYYKGIFLQARMTGCNLNETRTVGTFTNTDGDLQTRHCFGDVHSAVTHNSNRKKQLKSFYWTAPVVSSGHVVMRATIVRELTEYWTHVESPVVADLNAKITPKCASSLLPSSRARTSAVNTDSSTAVTNVVDGTRAEGTSRTSTLAKEKEVAEVTTKETEMTKKKTEVTTKKQSIEDAEGNLPSWLGPSFNEVKTTTETGTKDPSWLIPAYQTAVSSSPSLLTIRCWSYRCAMLVVSAIWTVVML